MGKGLWRAVVALVVLFAANAFGQDGDERILAAREAARTGDRATLERLAAEHAPHVLDAYVQYWLLANQLARPEPVPADALTEFLVEASGTVLAERLRIDWLRRMARDEDWTGYLRVFPDLVAPDQELTCYAWQARLATGDSTVLAEAARRWHELARSPGACAPVLQASVAAGRVTVEDLWWRLRRQVESPDPAAARDTIAWFPAAAAPSPKAFDKAVGSPAAYLDHLKSGFAARRDGRELALAALARLARQDVAAAHARLARIDDALTPTERAYAYGQLALQAALAQQPEASGWFRRAAGIPLGPAQRAWRVRAALRAGDWTQVASAIDALPDEERQRPEWIYWRARAFAAAGEAEAARALYGRIADEPRFYGLLAAEELDRPFSVPATRDEATAEDRRRAENDAGLRRALALFRLDMRTEAVREWNWSLRGQDPGFLLAAAELARAQQLYALAINTAERLDAHTAFNLRFLMPYRDLVEPQVKSQGLDMSWVYGLMRQESRFTIPARSSAGAQGLMQVMPATGRWVARKIGLDKFQTTMLSDPNTNVLVGTSYMRLILEGLDNHPVLASAGYNAGPARARRWRDGAPLEGAIYVETIPFDETRDYVKKVMTNTVIYAAMLEGRPQSLKARLGMIAPRTGD